MEKIKGRNIPFAVSLWDRLDKEAKKNGRSAVKQLEAILRERYGLDEAGGSADLEAELFAMKARLAEIERRTAGGAYDEPAHSQPTTNVSPKSPVRTGFKKVPMMSLDDLKIGAPGMPEKKKEKVG